MSESMQGQRASDALSEERETDELVARGIAAVEDAARVLAAASKPFSCRDIGQVFDTAIEHGAPIWNRGSQVGCAQIYLHAARTMLTMLRRRDLESAAAHSGQVETLLSALQQVSESSPVATLENAEQLGWTLRGVFDRFHAPRGMEDVSLLIGAIRRSGGAAE
jgi:hypothetical protein